MEGSHFAPLRGLGHIADQQADPQRFPDAVRYCDMAADGERALRHGPVDHKNDPSASHHWRLCKGSPARRPVPHSGALLLLGLPVMKRAALVSGG